MASSQDGNLGIWSGYTAGDNGWTAQHNQNWDTLDAFVQATVLSVNTTAPPGSPANGAAYVIPSGATGAWSGNTNNVAVWTSRGTGHWTIYAPKNGWLMYNQADGGEYLYNGSAWVVYYSQKLTVPQDYISGLKMIWNSATSISVSTGSAYVPSLGRLSTVSATLTLSGLTLTASTWYHLYLYESAGTPTIECVTTAPVIYQGSACQKPGDTSRRYVGSVVTDGSSNILNFYHDANSGEVFYNQDINIANLHVLTNGTATTATSVSCALAIPVTSRLLMLFTENTSNMSVIVRNPSTTGTNAVLFFMRPIDQCVNGKMLTDGSQNITYYATGLTSGNINIWVTGYSYER